MAIASPDQDTAQKRLIKRLYKNHRKTPDEKICELLEKIKIVAMTSKKKGEETKVGYFEISKKILKKILINPRAISHSLDFEPGNKVKTPLKEFKRIQFLVKSGSRVFVKPDIGEVFDQMRPSDIERTTAIETFLGVDPIKGENYHFIGTAILLH